MKGTLFKQTNSTVKAFGGEIVKEGFQYHHPDGVSGVMLAGTRAIFFLLSIFVFAGGILAAIGSWYFSPWDLEKRLEAANTPLPALVPVNAPVRGDLALWALTDNFCYEVSPTWTIIIPKGFLTDFASIPAPFRSFNPANYARAAIVHDYLYAIGEPGKQRIADRVFRQLLIEQGNHPKDIQLLYGAVWLLGINGYNKSGDLAFWDFDEGLVVDNPSTNLEQFPSPYPPWANKTNEFDALLRIAAAKAPYPDSSGSYCNADRKY